MADPNQRRSELFGLIDREVTALTLVLDALVSERAALEARDAEGLLAASDRKAEGIAGAGRLEQERRELLHAEPGLAEADAGIDRRFGDLRALAAHCRELNEANGLLIRGQRRRVEGSLRLLRGGRANADVYADVYGRNGETRLPRLRRGPLASY